MFNITSRLNVEDSCSFLKHFYEMHYLNASWGMVVFCLVEEKVLSFQRILITGSLQEIRDYLLNRGKNSPVITNICIILYGAQSIFTFIISFDSSFLFSSIPSLLCARQPSRLSGNSEEAIHCFSLCSQSLHGSKIKGDTWGLSFYSYVTDKLSKTQKSLNKHSWEKRSIWIHLSPRRCWSDYSLTSKWDQGW